MKRLAAVALLLFVASCAVVPPPPPPPPPPPQSVVVPPPQGVVVPAPVAAPATVAAPANRIAQAGNSAHLVLAVDVDAVLDDRMEMFRTDVGNALRANHIAYDMSRNGAVLAVRITDAARVAQARTILGRLCAEPGEFQMSASAPDMFAVAFADGFRREYARQVMAQSVIAVGHRLDAFATSQPRVKSDANAHVVVDLPGYADLDRLRRVFTPKGVELHAVDEALSDADVKAGRVPPDVVLLDQMFAGPGAPPLAVYKAALLTGDHVTDARQNTIAVEPYSAITLTLDPAGAVQLGDITRDNVGRRIAIVLDNRVISAPIVREPIRGGVLQISGGISQGDAVELATLLGVDASAAPMKIVELSLR